MNDIEITNHGSLFLFQPLNDEVKSWLNENVSADSQWFGGALVVEHRYAANLAEGLQDAGFNVA
jgi:hypothetical protein